MTTTDIHNWKGIEFSKEFVDFTVTGMLEAKATGSVQTGRMVRSIKMKKIADGFSVYSDRNQYPAFPFIFIAFDTVGESDQLVNSTSGFFGIYKALRPSGRRGAGTARYNSSDTASAREYLVAQGRKNQVKIPRRVAR